MFDNICAKLVEMLRTCFQTRTNKLQEMQLIEIDFFGLIHRKIST